MIQIARSLARTLRATFRKVGDVRSRAKPAFVCFRADDSGLRIQAQAGAIGAEHRIVGSHAPESFVLPFAALADFEGAANKPVSFTVEANGVRAEWCDGGIPQRRVYALVRSSALWFDPPALMQEVGDGSVLADINEAMEVCASDQVRFALSCVQLRGSKGQAVGSDGRQLLVVRGLSLPWPDDVLVPATRLFASKIFTAATTVEMVRTDERVVVRVGPWTVWLAIEKAGRYPNVDSVIPKETTVAARIVLAPEDADFLLRALPRLPSGDSEFDPVTLHVNGQVVVRGRSETSPLTELVLSRSHSQGREMRTAASRAYVLRAARLGLRNIRFAADNSPVVCENNRHVYVWQPLDATAILSTADDAIRIDSTADGEPIPPAKTDPRPTTDPLREVPMSSKSETIRPDEPATETPDEVLGDPIHEAEALRSRIRELLVDAGRVVRSLKRQGRQAKLVRSTLASLKQLQAVA
jgi:hypothetical protein